MRRLVRAVGALVALTTLLIVVPVCLATFVGRPWPRPMPSFDTVWRAIRAGDINDTTVIKALAIVVWIAWARLALSVAIEVVARFGGHDAPRVGLLGSAQHWAAALVAAVTLVGIAPRPAVAAGAGGGAPRPIPAALLQPAGLGDVRVPSHRQGEHEPVVSDHTNTVVPTDIAGRDEPARAIDRIGRSSIDEGAAPSTTLHVVRRSESFWSIAEDTLGDGSRWREIVALNSGHEVAPGVVFDGTANRLLPGWVLLVPDAAPHIEPITDPPGPTAYSVAAAPDEVVRTVVVESGDTLSAIAAEQLGDPNQWRELWETNRGHEFNGRVFDDPNLIVTGWELIVPEVFTASATPPAPGEAIPPVPAEVVPPVPVEAASPPTDETLPPPTVEIAPLATVEVNPPTPEAESPDEPVLPAPTGEPSGAYDSPGAGLSPPVLTPVVDVPAMAEDPSPESLPAADRSALPSMGGLGAALLLASGVIGAVGVRRRRRLRGAVIDARLAAPSATSIAVEHGLRRLGDGERIARLDISLRAAARELLDVSPGAAIIGALMSADGRLDLLLSGAARSAPAPWMNVTDHRWRLPSSVPLSDLAEAARQSNQPCPALAHLGRTPLDALEDAEVFIDLEAVGLLAVDGPPAESAAIVRAIAAGISVSPMAEIAHIIITGFETPLRGHPSTQSADSLDVALDLAAGAIGATAGLTAGSTSTFVLRARHQGGEAWEPAIVLAVRSESTEARSTIADADLVDLAGTGGRGLAVVVDRPVNAARWSIRPGTHHWCLQPLGLELTPIGLTETDVHRIDVLLDEADRPLQQPPDLDTTEVSVEEAPAAELPWTLMVRLLGPVEVMSADLRTVEFERSKALELVVWLTQHRDRSTRTGARTALWESNVRDATFANVVSDARRNLARLEPPAEGEEWLGRTLTEELPLHPAVVTDAEILSDRLRACRGLNPQTAITTLRPALSLIRDMPFSGTSYLWPDSEGISSQLTLLATSAATVLAGHYLTIGDTDGVFWATGQGLKVLPGHEELIALRMRAHGRQGDLAGVRREWESYERVLNAEAWSDGEPSPKLVALRRELLSLRA